MITLNKFKRNQWSHAQYMHKQKGVKAFTASTPLFLGGPTWAGYLTGSFWELPFILT